MFYSLFFLCYVTSFEKFIFFYPTVTKRISYTVVFNPLKMYMA